VLDAVSVPQSVREQWAVEVEAERALADAQEKQERDAAAAVAAENLAVVQADYEKARKAVQRGIAALTASMRKCAELRVEYENVWRAVAAFEEQGAPTPTPLRLASLTVDAHELIPLTGRV
jgi:hypothetical protein